MTRVQIKKWCFASYFCMCIEALFSTSEIITNVYFESIVVRFVKAISGDFCISCHLAAEQLQDVHALFQNGVYIVVFDIASRLLWTTYAGIKVQHVKNAPDAFLVTDASIFSTVTLSGHVSQPKSRIVCTSAQ